MTCTQVLAFAGLLAGSLTATAQPAATLILSRVDAPPLVDGDLSDAAWSNAAPLAVAGSATGSTELLLCFSKRALHVALLGTNADATAPVSATDDLTVWIKSTDDGAEYDRFHLTPTSARDVEHHRITNRDGLPAKPEWKAVSVVTSNRWVAEVTIPFADLGRYTVPMPGESFELKLARQGVTLWPAGAATTAPEQGYGMAYFERANVLKNADMTETNDDGTPAVWELRGQIRRLVEDGEPVILMDATQDACRIEQTVKVPANQICRLSAEFKGEVEGHLRVKGHSGESLLIDVQPSATWHRQEISFIPSAAGPCYVIGETLDTGPLGRFELRGLMLAREPTANVAGRAIPVPVDGAGPYLVQRIPVVDCRAVRGFFGQPIDGTTDSPDYSDSRWEYNYLGEQANAAVRYLYHANDGLHITLGDREGVDAIQVLGGVAADVVADCQRYDDPASGRKIGTFPGGANNSLMCLAARVPTDRISFFHVRDGYIADLNCFRFGGDVAKLGTAERAPIAGTADTRALAPYFERRFDEAQRTAWAAFQTSAPPPVALTLTAGRAIHVVAGPFPTERSLAGIGLEGVVDGITGPVPLTVQVQDFLHPRTAVTTAMLELAGPGRLALALGIPDQIIPPGKVLWITLTSRRDFTLASPQLVLYSIPREQALPGAMAYRLTKLKGFWDIMSEERPWNSLRRNDNVNAWLRRLNPEFERERVTEIRDAIDYLYGLKPDDSIVAQYYNWFYRGRIRPELPPARLPEEPGAPEWAVVVRTAWLEARSVPNWWVSNRLVPTGEFGGHDDDGSMYQNFANFPMFEADGLGAALKHGAACRADLDQHLRLDQGLGRTSEDPLHFYEDGLNQESLVTWWHYGDPLFLERCMLTAKNMEVLTMVNAAGHRHFKGDIVGAEFLRHPERQPINYDSGFSAQMLQPVCELTLYNHNPRAQKFLRELGDAWVDHMTNAVPPAAPTAPEGRTPQLGKMGEGPGEYPLGVDVVTDKPVDTSPEPYAGGFGNHVSLMAFLARITGDPKYLQPLVQFFAKGEYAESTGSYLPDLYQLGYLDKQPAANAKEFPYSPALEWLATGNKEPFLKDLKNDIAEMQTFRFLYTAVEPFTDRIFLYAGINPARAYTGGYATRNKMYHSHAVSWQGFGTNYAALVRAGRPDRFQALVYNFNAEPAQGSMRFWMLDHGLYDLTVGVDTNGDDQADTVLATQRVEIVRGDRVPLELPPRAVTVVTLTQAEKLDPVEERADLALSPWEITLAGGAISGVAHNIGSRDLANVLVELRDETGGVRQRAELGNLAAPVNLNPQRIPFRLEGLPANHHGWRIVARTAQPVPEITTANNVVILP